MSIKFLLIDVDGVLTDGKIIIDDKGREIKNFSVYDGLGIKLAQKNNIKIGLISGRSAKAIIYRAKELNVEEVYLGIEDKKEVLNKILKKYKLKKENIAYIGDDINDLEIMQEVGLKIAPNNAHKKVKEVADVITKNKGGEGAVREAIEDILELRAKSKV